MSDLQTTSTEAVNRATGEAVAITGVHPVADLFPRLEGDDFRELVESIRAVGLDQPIILDGQGRILDGRNRFAACQEAGVKPETVPYEGDDPDDYALRTNNVRRHMTTGARAIVAEQARRLTGKSQVEEAACSDLNRARIVQAGTILDWAPEHVPAVLAGAAFSVAYDEARTKKEEAADLKRRVDRLAESAEDLHQLVLEERMSLDDATAALDAREAKVREEELREESELRKRGKVELERQQRFTESVAQSILSIHACLAPNAAEAAVTSWDPDTAAAYTELPLQAERFTAKGIREAARLLTELAQYANGLEGRTL